MTSAAIVQSGRADAMNAASRWPAVLPIVCLPAFAMATTWHLPGWALMWAVAFAFYAAFKWLTWWDARDARRSASLRRNAAYLLAWPGMDAKGFLNRTCAHAPSADEWIWPMVNMACGASLIWFAAPRLTGDWPLAAGWCGMVGIGLILHFGVFGLLSAMWRFVGIDAPRQFHLPVASPSLDAFWSRRWNRAFRDLSRTYVLLPLMRRCGPAAGVLAVYVGSGLIHELVISLPARAGWGLPTVYFVAQGVGILIANSKIGRRAHLNRGVIGRLWMALVVVGPLYWLFHPPFVHAVVLPFLEVIGGA